MPQIHIALIDNPPSRKLANVEVHLPATTIEIHHPDLERPSDLPTLSSLPALTIKGITIWSTPDGPVVTFPPVVSSFTPPTVYGPSAQPARRVLAALVDDILTAYCHAAGVTLTSTAHRTTAPPFTATRVGDRVRVRHPCLGNPANTIAVCYEVYDRGDGTPGISLLFPNGEHDGFSPHDAEVFIVARIDHLPALASYQFTNVVRLAEDFRAGVFASVWLTPLPDAP